MELPITVELDEDSPVVQAVLSVAYDRGFAKAVRDAILAYLDARAITVTDDDLDRIDSFDRSMAEAFYDKLIETDNVGLSMDAADNAD
jgi:hypothetical protein